MKYTAILALAVLALMIAGCSSSTPQTPVQTSTGQDTQADTTTTTTTTNQDAAEEFEELFSTKAATEFKVDYVIKTSAEGQTMTSTMSQYMKGEEKIRADMAFNDMESRTYIMGEDFTTCTRQDNAEWSCYKLPESEQGDEEVPIVEVKEDFEENPDEYTITRDGTMQVAGVTATCYKMTTTGEDASVVTYCFSKEAVPLYVKMESDEYLTEMTATTYSTRVSNSDFNLPEGAEVQEYGAATGTMPAGGDYCDACNYLSGDDRDECLASC
jgi:hypothetical protein